MQVPADFHLQIYCLHCLLFKVHFTSTLPFHWLCFGVASLEAAFIYYHAAFFLSTTFFNFFSVAFCFAFAQYIFHPAIPCSESFPVVSSPCCLAAGQLLYYTTGFGLLQPTLISIYLYMSDLFVVLCFILCFISVLFFMLLCDMKNKECLTVPFAG